MITLDRHVEIRTRYYIVVFQITGESYQLLEEQQAGLFKTRIHTTKSVAV